jgi:hypothetical protein
VSVSGRIILNALEVSASEGVEAGWLDESVFDNVPESTVFVPDAEAPWDDDDVAAIKMVGEQDVAAKIAYWRGVLDGADK